MTQFGDLIPKRSSAEAGENGNSAERINNSLNNFLESGYGFSLESMFPAAREVWIAGGDHVNSVGGRVLFWLRNNFPMPHKGHLLFRNGNQLFSVFVDSDLFPISDQIIRESFLGFAQELRAIPCILRMESRGGRYVSALPGWGLVHAVTGDAIDPFEMVTDELIEVSDAELHQLSVFCARDLIESADSMILSSNSFSDFEPGLIFRKDMDTKWAVIRGFRVENLNVEKDLDLITSKLSEMEFPEDISNIAEACSNAITNVKNGIKTRAGGLFVAVGFASADFLLGETLDQRLYRGKSMVGMTVVQDLDRVAYLEPTAMMIGR